MTRRTIRRVITFALGCSWLLLGFLSDGVPLFSEPVWIILCTLAAGSAFALAHWTTMYALKRYTLIVVAIGGLRAAGYGHDGVWGPGVVWMIVALTTAAAALSLIAQAWVAENGGDRGSG